MEPAKTPAGGEGNLLVSAAVLGAVLALVIAMLRLLWPDAPRPKPVPPPAVEAAPAAPVVEEETITPAPVFPAFEPVPEPAPPAEPPSYEAYPGGPQPPLLPREDGTFQRAPAPKPPL